MKMSRKSKNRKLIISIKNWNLIIFYNSNDKIIKMINVVTNYILPRLTMLYLLLKSVIWIDITIIIQIIHELPN